MKKKKIIFMSIYTIAIYLIVALASLTSCSASIEKESEREKKEERRVNTLTVVDVNSGDTIQIELSRNGGVPSRAYIIK
jgi:hypothetical protein